MRWLLAPLWNAEERRLRALVRVGLQLGVFMALSAGVQLAFERLHLIEGDRRMTDGALYLVSALLVVASVWAGCRLLDRRELTDLGLRLDLRWLVDAGFGLALGGLLMLGILALEVRFGWASYALAPPRSGGLSRLEALPVSVVAFLVVALTEELVFRGYQLVNLAEGIRGGLASPAAAVLGATLVSSLLFGAAHLLNPHADAGAAGNVAFAGGLLAAGFLLTGELAIPIGLHLGWNFFQNLFGMPVSGQSRFFYVALLQRTETGPDWITGGPFGPEAGLTGLVAMVAGTLSIFLYARALEGRLGIHPSLLRGRPGR